MRTRLLHTPAALVGALAVLVAPLAVAALAPASAAAAGYVRVNQVGYPDAGSKRAYFMTETAAPVTTFAVRDSGGARVLTGLVGPCLGAWSARFGFVYPVDFTGLTAAGTYTIAVDTGNGTAVSPHFRVCGGSSVYRRALSNTLAFYQVQRDGPAFVRSALRTAAAHLNDRHAMTYRTPTVDGDGVFRGDLRALGRRVDAGGGWWDAGDYLKFVHTTAYAEALLLTGVRDDPAQMGAGSSTSDFTAEVKFGASWLLRMWDDRRRVFYYQVGIGSGNAHTAGDHDLWRLPQRDDHYRRGDAMYRYIRHRPVFRLGPPGAPISPNLAGRDSAALALAYQVFKKTDPGFAARCLRSARHIFDQADLNPRQLVTAIPFDYYPETEWRDDMELGAAELDLALAGGGPSEPPHDAAYYLGQAARWAAAYMASPDDASDTLNLYDVSGLAHYELVRAMRQAGDPSGLDVTEGQVLADMRKALDRALTQASLDPFQFGYAWARWDTATHGAGLSVMASEYDELTGTGEYADWSGRWLAAILGANAWGTSLVVGDGSVFPHCLQHQVANLRGTLDGRRPVLLGACVEGPNSDQDDGTMPGMRLGPSFDAFKPFNGGHGARWRDAVQDYPNTEPAIDLTAPTALAFARAMRGLR